MILGCGYPSSESRVLDVNLRAWVTGWSQIKHQKRGVQVAAGARVEASDVFVDGGREGRG